MVAALLLAGVLFIVQTWVAALLVPDPAGLIANGDPGGTAFYDAAAVAGGAWLATLTALATAIAWGFANSLVAQAATSRLLFAMARDRQLPSFLAQGAPDARACRSTPPCWSRSSRSALGLYMATRDDGITLLSHAGQLRRADRVPGAARLRGLALRRPAAAAGTGGGTWSCPVDRVRDPRCTSSSTRTSPRRRSASSGWRSASCCWSSCYATGRTPELALAPRTAAVTE